MPALRKRVGRGYLITDQRGEWQLYKIVILSVEVPAISPVAIRFYVYRLLATFGT